MGIDSREYKVGFDDGFMFDMITLGEIGFVEKNMIQVNRYCVLLVLTRVREFSFCLCPCSVAGADRFPT